MDTLIFYAIPVFVLSMLLEHRHARRHGAHPYERRDTRASLWMGVGAALVGLPFRVFFVWMLGLVYSHRLFTISMGLGAYLALFLCEDVCYYFSHRTNHEVRLFWAGHVNHHSSEHYHLATALRQSVTQPFLMWIFWLPLPLLGFAPELVLMQQGISLIYQFFIHTEEVRTLGPLEWLLNTPSHHRVHHAVNLAYLDRNHGGILIVWDRLFGTFAQENTDDPPVYGITKNLHSFSLTEIAFHEWRALFADVRRAPGLLHKLKCVFCPPGYSHDGSTLTARQLRAAAASSIKV